MKIEVWKQWEIRDSKGKLVRRTRRKKANSYLLAMADILYAQMTAAGQSIPDTSNTSRSVSAAINNLRVQAGQNVDTDGTVVGTGTNAVALADYALQTKIADGTGSGQLSYGTNSYSAPITSGTTRRFTITRTFTNNSGASITVNETAMYGRATTTPFYFCIERALESPGVAIANLAAGTLVYTIGVTV